MNNKALDTRNELNFIKDFTRSTLTGLEANNSIEDYAIKNYIKEIERSLALIKKANNL